MIYVIRHGETDANYYGDTLRGFYYDDELNEVGMAQAQATALQLADISFDVCYCSPLKRTLQTCKPIFDGEIILEKRIMPRDYGELIEKKMTANDLNTKGYWDRELNLPVKNGETALQVEARIRQFLDEITKKHKGQKVLVVTHGSITGVIKGVIDNFSRGSQYHLYRAKNCEIVTIPN